MSRVQGSPAARMLEAHGPDYCKKYLSEPALGCGYTCSAKHPYCAHYGNGPCRVELAALVGVTL